MIVNMWNPHCSGVHTRFSFSSLLLYSASGQDWTISICMQTPLSLSSKFVFPHLMICFSIYSSSFSCFHLLPPSLWVFTCVLKPYISHTSSWIIYNPGPLVLLALSGSSLFFVNKCRTSALFWFSSSCKLITALSCHGCESLARFSCFCRTCFSLLLIDAGCSLISFCASLSHFSLFQPHFLLIFYLCTSIFYPNTFSFNTVQHNVYLLLWQPHLMLL